MTKGRNSIMCMWTLYSNNKYHFLDSGTRLDGKEYIQGVGGGGGDSSSPCVYVLHNRNLYLWLKDGLYDQ